MYYSSVKNHVIIISVFQLISIDYIFMIIWWYSINDNNNYFMMWIWYYNCCIYCFRCYWKTETCIHSQQRRWGPFDNLFSIRSS